MSDKIREVNLDYFTWPFYKKWWYNIKNFFKDKKDDFHFRWSAFIILIIIIALFGILVAIIVTNKIDTSIHAAYDYEADGLVGYGDIDEKMKDSNGNYKSYYDSRNETITLSNTSFDFIYDCKTSYFTLKNKVTNEEFYSVPDPTSSTSIAKDTLIISYANQTGNLKSIGNYNYAIGTGLQTFYIKVLEDQNAIQVHYVFNNAGYTVDMFPYGLSVEKYNEYLEALKEYDAANRTTLNRTFASYYWQATINGKYTYGNAKEDAWYTRKRDSYLPSAVALKNMYKAYYIALEYNEEMLYEDNLAFDDQFGTNYAAGTNPNYYAVSVQYSLTDTGFDAKILNHTIQETKDKPMIYIDLLPYFCAADSDDEGYTLIPDGSGVLINFNNNKSYASSYTSKRIYGTDYANASKTLTEAEENISMPMYGMRYVRKNGDTILDTSAFIGIITEGAEMAQMLSYNASSQIPYNRSYLRFYLREGTSYVFPDWQNPLTVTSWTKTYCKDDFTISYKFITEDESKNYVGMAQLYKDYLISNGDIPDSKLDDTTSPILNLTLVGGYQAEASFAGIPYKYVDSLTNTKEVKSIVNELVSDEISFMNIIYKGWSNKGVNSRTYKKITFNSKIGSKKEIKNLYSYVNNLGENIHFYPEVMLETVYTTSGMSAKKDFIRDGQGEIVELYNFNQATSVYDTTSTPYYYLKPDKLQKQVSSFAKNYDKLNFNTIAISDLGSILNGSYKNSDTQFRSDALEAYEKSMLALKNKIQDLNIISENPNIYALKYTDSIINLATSGTNYQIVDRVVPFYQLVLSGSYDYAGESMNIQDNYTFQYHLLKCIETGSNLNFTWTYDETFKLINTEQNNYYATYYKNSYDKAVDFYKELDSMGIYKGALTNHTSIDGSNDIILVTYTLPNSEKIHIGINYSTVDYDYAGTIIPSNQYKIL